MKKFIFLSVVLISFSCSNNDTKKDGDKKDSTATSSGTPLMDPSANALTNPNPAPPAGVSHYICTNCGKGKGEAEGPCPSCGKTMVHNADFHPAAPGGANTANTAAPVNINDLKNNPAPNMNPTPEPPQNSKGVWHFTCPKGHSGGGGSAANCPSCGTTMSHNAAYHQ